MSAAAVSAGATGVEGQARPPVEQLAAGVVARRTRRDLARRRGQRQRLGRHRLQQRVERRALGLGVDGLRRCVAAQRVAVLDAAQQMRRSVHLVAVAEVERHQDLLQGRQRTAVADGGLPETVERDAADGQLVAQRLDGVGAVVPERARRRGGAGRSGVGVGDVAEAALAVLFEHPSGLGVVADVAVADRLSVPFAHADGVGVRHVDGAVHQRRQRGGVVHGPSSGPASSQRSCAPSPACGRPRGPRAGGAARARGRGRGRRSGRRPCRAPAIPPRSGSPGGRGASPATRRPSGSRPCVGP